MRKMNMLVLSAAFFMGAMSVHASETPTVYDIVDRANKVAYYSGDDGRSKVQMTITDTQGRTRQREFVILRYDVEDGGRQNFYVYFKKPSDVREMAFMVHKYIDRDDDRWLYLPALDLVKRIAASDKRTSFVGSHFFYEDVKGLWSTRGRIDPSYRYPFFIRRVGLPPGGRSAARRGKRFLW